MHKKIFKYCILIITFIFSFLLFNSNVNASIKKIDLKNNVSVAAVTDDLTNEEFNVCESSGIVKTFQIIGYCLFILKIFVPLALIAMGIIDFAKAMIANDPNDIKNAMTMFAKRAIAGVVIFFIPTIVTFVFELVDKADTSKNFECLTNCLYAKKSCNVPDDDGLFSNSN